MNTKVENNTVQSALDADNANKPNIFIRFLHGLMQCCKYCYNLVRYNTITNRSSQVEELGVQDGGQQKNDGTAVPHFVDLEGVPSQQLNDQEEEENNLSQKKSKQNLEVNLDRTATKQKISKNQELVFLKYDSVTITTKSQKVNEIISSMNEIERQKLQAHLLYLHNQKKLKSGSLFVKFKNGNDERPLLIKYERDKVNLNKYCITNCVNDETKLSKVKQSPDILNLNEPSTDTFIHDENIIEAEKNSGEEILFKFDKSSEKSCEAARMFYEAMDGNTRGNIRNGLVTNRSSFESLPVSSLTLVVKLETTGKEVELKMSRSLNPKTPNIWFLQGIRPKQNEDIQTSGTNRAIYVSQNYKDKIDSLIEEAKDENRVLGRRESDEIFLQFFGFASRSGLNVTTNGSHYSAGGITYALRHGGNNELHLQTIKDDLEKISKMIQVKTGN